MTIEDKNNVLGDYEKTVFGFNEETLRDYEKDLFGSNEKTSGAMNQGLNSAQKEMIGAGIGGAAEVLSTGIGAGFQASELKSAQKEARELAEQKRSDENTQTNIDYGLRRRELDQEKQSLNLKKTIENFELSHKIWLQNLEKAIDFQEKKNEATKKIFGNMNRSEKIKNLILKAFGGK